MRKINNLLFSWDSLTIYDGASSTSPMMGEYCGNSIPPSHVSSSNEVLVHFQSDDSVTYGGFKMEYNPIRKQNILIQNNIERRKIKFWESFLVDFLYRINQNATLALFL